MVLILVDRMLSKCMVEWTDYIEDLKVNRMLIMGYCSINYRI